MDLEPEKSLRRHPNVGKASEVRENSSALGFFQNKARRPGTWRPCHEFIRSRVYKADSMGSPMPQEEVQERHFEFFLATSHSRRRVERDIVWSQFEFANTHSNSTMVGITGPIGSGLPQLGLPRLFAIYSVLYCDQK